MASSRLYLPESCRSPVRITADWDRRDFEATTPPPQWEARLRQFSPVVEHTSHLRFRLHPGQTLPDGGEKQPRWVLYEAIPKALLPDDRIAQFQTHHSEMPAHLAFARQKMVSDYQHYMYHKYGVDVRPCWVLQGSQGGTPAAYTDREQRLLQDVNQAADVPPVGLLPPCPFDERAITALLARDALLKIGGDLNRLEQSRTPAEQEKEQAATEKAFRTKFLAWYMESMRPMAEFMAWYTKRTEADMTLRKASATETNHAAQFQDHFIETGDWLPADPVAS